MRILKSFIIAFSMYSQIPMPQFEWKEEDMKYMLCFFPLVGAVIGLCLYGWEKLCMGMEINGVCRTLVGTAIPLLLTGGIHVDGYMDTMDAFHSYQSRERKIEILKDMAVSDNRGERRAVAVSLIIPARKGKFLQDIFQISDMLLMDKDDLVQKAYGWLLKVASDRHLNDVFEYVIRNKQIMPRTALRYAIEKMPSDLRKQAMMK